MVPIIIEQFEVTILGRISRRQSVDWTHLHEWRVERLGHEMKEFDLDTLIMVVCVELGMIHPEIGVVRLDDIILVTDTGHEILSKVEYDDKLLA